MAYDGEYTYTPRERLLLIADALDDVKPRDFHLGSWATCSLGHAIKKHGSALNMRLAYHPNHRDRVPYLNGAYAFAKGNPWSRIAEHLGITESTAAALFGSMGARGYGLPEGQHPTPKQAAERIRWVANMQPEPQHAV